MELDLTRRVMYENVWWSKNIVVWFRVNTQADILLSEMNVQS